MVVVVVAIAIVHLVFLDWIFSHDVPIDRFSVMLPWYHTLALVPRPPLGLALARTSLRWIHCGYPHPCPLHRVHHRDCHVCCCGDCTRASCNRYSINQSINQSINRSIIQEKKGKGKRLDASYIFVINILYVFSIHLSYDVVYKSYMILSYIILSICRMCLSYAILSICRACLSYLSEIACEEGKPPTVAVPSAMAASSSSSNSSSRIIEGEGVRWY